MGNQRSFIEVQFPVSKVSKESYKERKAGSGQTLTGLGKWWGRKPLVLVRAALVGLLLPASDEPRKDMEIFLKIMAMDKKGLRNRRTKSIPVKKIFELMTTREREQYFMHRDGEPVAAWKTGLSSEEKAEAVEKAWNRMSYDQKLIFCVRPEEYQHTDPAVWQEINHHLGTDAASLPELIEALGSRRFGRRAVVGDCFCGGGSVPFEAARIGNDVYASDLNPVAGLLTWASLNIAGAGDEKIAEIRHFQQKVYEAVDQQVVEWGIETNEQNERANTYLYCHETTCPECGHLVPLSPSWVIGKGTMTAAFLQDNGTGFDIEVRSGLSAHEISQAESKTTVRGKDLYCPHCTKSIPISALRKNSSGENGLRLWEQHDFMPRSDDVFQERLYCIRYTDQNGRRYYTAPTVHDLERDRKVIELLAERFQDWQEKGYIPSVAIEMGDETTRLLRERGWSYWHHLFNPRQLLVHGLFMAMVNEKAAKKEEIICSIVSLNKCIDFNSKICRWGSSREDSGKQAFYNQAFNTIYNWVDRTLISMQSNWLIKTNKIRLDLNGPLSLNVTIADARNNNHSCDIWITDPPYADAIYYHELSEFFLAWDRKLLEKAFPDWYTDSKRVLAVRGRDDSFAESMIEIYRNLADHMPDHGMQIIMFTHQDVGVWAELRNIVWAAGLQVTAAWTIATETDSIGFKSGNYVKGTVLLVLRKRASQRTAYLDEIMPEVEDEVKAQVNSMQSLDHRDDPNFSDADYILAAYAASLKVLTAYERIEDVDVARALRGKDRGDVLSPVVQVIESAKKIVYDLLVPEVFDATPDKQYTWKLLTPPEKFYIKGLELEKNSIYQLSAYQELARGFGVSGYAELMASTKANAARLKTPREWAGRGVRGEGFAGTVLRQVLMALYVSIKHQGDAVAGKNWLKNEVPVYDGGGRKMIIDFLEYLATLEPIANMSHWEQAAATASILKELVAADGV